MGSLTIGIATGFWVFVGVVAGALIQYLFFRLTLHFQRRNAREVLLAEIEINKDELNNVLRQIARKKERFVSGQQKDHDLKFDFSGFNYRMVDPLINSGHFHSILGPEGVKRYFRFMSDLNYQSAENYSNYLEAEHKNGRSIDMLDHLLEHKALEWRDTLAAAEKSART